MHKKFVRYFCDPITHEPLELVAVSGTSDTVEEGFLQSPTAKYPIIRGVPRFTGHSGENYAASFGYQWHRWSKAQFESENVGRPMAGHTTRMWEAIVGRDAQANAKLLLDIGCGPGRFVDVARKKGAIVIGIDYSSAVEVAADIFRHDPDVCICQGDALALPIKNDTIDAAFSIGVLHHTPAPAKGVYEAGRVIKKGGWLALAVYLRGGYYDAPVVSMWRKIFRLTWPVLGHYPPLIYSYFTVFILRPFTRIPILGTLLKAIFPFFDLPDARWSVLDTFDSVTPAYQTGHTAYEVFTWFKEGGFVNVEPTEWGSTRGWKAGKYVATE